MYHVTLWPFAVSTIMIAVAQLPDPTIVTSVFLFSGMHFRFASKVEIAVAIVKKNPLV